MSEAEVGGQGEELSSAAGGAHGTLFVICSPSGGGKGTLIQCVLKTVPDLGYSISWTTRPPREGEQHGVDYYFVTPETFDRMVAHGEFLEYARVHGHCYGTALSVVEHEMAAGRDVILEIDVQGAEAVRTRVKNSVSVFILPPSFETLRERLAARKSETPESLALRLHNARGEVEQYRAFDYLILNDTAERAAAQLASIVYAERARRERQEWIAQRVLATFP